MPEVSQSRHCRAARLKTAEFLALEMWPQARIMALRRKIRGQSFRPLRAWLICRGRNESERASARRPSAANVPGPKRYAHAAGCASSSSSAAVCSKGVCADGDHVAVRLRRPEFLRPRIFRSEDVRPGNVRLNDGTKYRSCAGSRIACGRCWPATLGAAQGLAFIPRARV